MKKQGHLAALFTILIWGTTFISTKILLADFEPIEILFFRFVMGYIALLAVYPHRLKKLSRQQEITFVAAGFCGVCLYYLLENIALTYTMASNVGVIISVAPFITAILAHLFIKAEEKLQINFFIGFIVAIAGIILISFNGSQLKLNPVGDILAFAAAFTWACYSILTKKIGSFGLSVILTTRRTFFYDILFMIPALSLSDFQSDMSRFTDITNLLNILYLGIGASALCFVTWNYAVKILGAVKTSIYIYMVPVITVITSVLILRETVSQDYFFLNIMEAKKTEKLFVYCREYQFRKIYLYYYQRRFYKMDLQNEKCVMIIDENLSLGIIANTAAIMGITLGKKMPEIVGTDICDRTGNRHLGIIEFPIPILKGNADIIKAIREKLYEPDFSDLTVVDFSNLAQGCKTYAEFIEKMKRAAETDLNYLGIAICGAKKKVNKLTGSMALLR